MATGFTGVQTRVSKSQMETLTVQEAFEMHMKHAHWMVDARLVKKFYEAGAELVEWVEALGVEFVGVYKYFPQAQPTWHMVKIPGIDRPAERSSAIMMKALADEAIRLGAKVEYFTVAYEIIMEDGRAVGVKAKDQNNEEVEVRADVVMVGTNGFSDNKEMEKELLGDWSKLPHGKGFSIPGLSGDGMRMCWDAGANHVHFIHHGGCFVVGLTDLYKTLGEVMHQFNLVVDLNGERIINEWMFTNSVYIYELVSRCKGRQFFMIMNDEILDYYREHGLDIYQMQHGVTTIENWDKELEAYLRGDKADTAMAEMHEGDNRPNGFYVFDTIEEMCAELGINEKNLKKTLERYNSMGFHDDLDFYKPAKFMRPINGGKYYVARYTPFGSDPIGGVKTNENMECLTDDGDVIPGLYSMGNDSNNNYADCYNHNYSGGGNGFAINSGRIAAWEAVKYIQSQEA